MLRKIFANFSSYQLTLPKHLCINFFLIFSLSFLADVVILPYWGIRFFFFPGVSIRNPVVYYCFINFTTLLNNCIVAGILDLH